MVKTLSNDCLRLCIDPDLGASVTGLETLINNKWQPVCVSETATVAPTHAGQSALFYMLPFANRARDNLLIGSARSWQVEPNMDEPLALHGVVWTQKWTVKQSTGSAIVLTCSVNDEAPFPCDAELLVSLNGATIVFRLTVTARGPEPVPVGMGFHPFFPRTPRTFVTFSAAKRWAEGADHLPTTSENLAENEGYGMGRLLPSSWQNTCFTGWNGTASIDQPDLGYSVRIRASRGLGALMVYSTPDLDRFAVEPQSHLSGRTIAGRDGLRMIAPDQGWSEEMQLQVSVYD